MGAAVNEAAYRRLLGLFASRSAFPTTPGKGNQAICESEMAKIAAGSAKPRLAISEGF
jgi:hypothetical protein